MIRFRYFDDDAVDAGEVAADLGGGDVSILVSAPTQTMDIPTDAQLDGYLVDYVLSTRVTFQGGTLAAALAERGRDVPIVLLTRENLVEGRTEAELLDDLPQFDAVVFKGHIHEARVATREQLRCLAEGYAGLRAAEKTLDGLINACHPPSDRDRQVLLELSPPVVRGEWRTPNVARWLSQTVVRYPGALVDALSAASSLGVTEATFRGEAMSTYFRPASYDGPMAPPDGRWWKAKLLELAADQALTGDRGPIYVEFPKAFEEAFGPVDRAMCVDECGNAADAVCYVLRAPVWTAHSLIYFPDQRPRVMDAARVSFLAVQTDNRVRPELIDPTAQAIVRRLIEQGPIA